MAYEKWKDKRKNSAFAQLSGREKKVWGKTWESESPQDQGFNCNLSTKWAAVGRLQSRSKGFTGYITKESLLLSMSVCTYIHVYRCINYKESANKLCRFLIYDITRSQ